MSTYWKKKNQVYQSPQAGPQTVYSILYDDTTNIIHVIDENISGTYSVTNAMSYHFLHHIFASSLPIWQSDDVRLFLYGTDGMIVEWKAGLFKPLDEGDYYLIHDDFVKQISNYA